MGASMRWAGCPNARSPVPQGCNLRERFTVDAADRVTRHELPEGGALRYTGHQQAD